MLCKPRGHRSETPAHRNWSSPCSPQLEKSPSSKRRPSTAKKKKEEYNLGSKPSSVTSRLCEPVSFLHASISSSGKWNYNQTRTSTGLQVDVLRTLGTYVTTKALDLTTYREAESSPGKGGPLPAVTQTGRRQNTDPFTPHSPLLRRLPSRLYLFDQTAYSLILPSSPAMGTE